IRMGKDGMPQLPPGAGRGPMMMMNGRGHLAAKNMNMAGIVDLLARQLDRPVLDQTGLKGNYDFTLDYTPEEGQGMMLPPGIPPPGAAEAHAAIPESSSGLSLSAAMQAQLGLKLEPKKGPVDLVVLDHVEKIPTEN